MKVMRYILASMMSLGLLTSCRIEPPLVLPAQEVLVDLPVVITDMQVVWNVDTDLRKEWYYGWDEEDAALWGVIDYPTPTNYEVRRYYLGPEPGAPHTIVDPRTIYGNSFRATYEFGYYDMLIWSNIDSATGEQVVSIDESSLDEVTASTTITKGMLHMSSVKADAVTALYNQPEIFYSAYPRDVYISHNYEDYDYYDPEEKVYVKKIEATLHPLVYIYLVQVMIHNNDGRIVGVNGDSAISNMAASTSVNTGHTGNTPVMVYYGSRMKKDITLPSGESVDIIGGKLTTYGLCDMDSYTVESKAAYSGTKGNLENYIFVDFSYSNGATETRSFCVTDQCQSQCHGGVITINIDALDIKVPEGPAGGGSLFVPSVEDYDEIVYECPF